MSVADRLVAGLFLMPALIASVFGAPAMGKAPSLSLPLDCIAQESCFIQNYVDLDPSESVRDYSCGKSSYEGHKGVDFRILSISAMKRGVDVLASAPGIVKSVRDGMKDRLAGRKASPDISGRECGNGVVIDHGDGWETQYCHMRRGSLIVKKGEKVGRAQKLGLVGLSGKTAFPHVHLSVRHKGRTIDPFRGEQPSKAACMTKIKNTLWQEAVPAQFPYLSGQPYMWGFADRGVEKQVLMMRGGVPVPASTRAFGMVFFGQALNLQKGDRLGIRLTGPRGNIATTVSKPMERHKASFLIFAGKRRTNFAWPRGMYKGVFSLERNGKQVWQKTETLKLK